MAIALDCPCGASLRLPTVLAGHVGRCPGCGLPLRAPDPARAPAPADAPAPAPPVVAPSSPAVVAPSPPVVAPSPPIVAPPPPVVAPLSPPVASPAPPAPVAASRPAPAPPPTLPRIVRVECDCRRLVVAPGALVAAGTARCPTCDRRLDARRAQP